MECGDGTLKNMLRLSGVSSTRSTVAVVWTWPDTLWPPTSSPKRADRSKLKVSPTCRPPRLVARSVSLIKSKHSSFALGCCVTVRQVPFTDTLAPSDTPSTAPAGNAALRVANSSRCSNDTTRALP